MIESGEKSMCYDSGGERKSNSNMPSVKGKGDHFFCGRHKINGPTYYSRAEFPGLLFRENR
jgi:hypothetical protein